VLLVEIVEESANVPVLAETAAGASHATAIRCHVSPPASQAHLSEPKEQTRADDLSKELSQETDDADEDRGLNGAVVRMRSHHTEIVEW
jgi:hypothetical protein